MLDHFPWAWKASHLLGIRSASIEHDSTRKQGWFRVRDLVSVRISHPVTDPATVTCVIPGHHQSGQELVAESLWVGDEALAFEAAGKCAYRSVFEYDSRDSVSQTPAASRAEAQEAAEDGKAGEARKALRAAAKRAVDRI